MKISEVARAKRVLLLGDSKSGKTHLLGTLMQLIPTVYVTADPEGVETLASMEIPEKNHEIILMESWAKSWDYLGQINALRGKGFRALAVDDFGGQQRKLSTAIRGHRRGREFQMKANELEEEIRKTTLAGSRRLELRQFGEVAIGTEAWLAEIMKMDWPVLMMTALLDVRNHPLTGQEYGYPEAVGNIRYMLPALFGLVGIAFRAEYGNKVHFALTCKEHPSLPTGTRYGQGRTWVNPDAEKMLLHMNRAEMVEDGETPTEKGIGTGLEG